MHRNIEIIRERLTTQEALKIRTDAKREGAIKVNITRTLCGLVEIEIIYPDKLAAGSARKG